METNGKKLSCKGEAIWKGTFEDNGMLLKIHENCYTIGYSGIYSPDGTKAEKIDFGDGAFYDAKSKNNILYKGTPTTSGAVGVFAGIIARSPDIATGYPAIHDGVENFQKGLLVKDGYVEYKKAYVGSVSGEKVTLFDNANVTIGSILVADNATGKVYFVPKGTTVSNGVKVGYVVSLNPDDKTVTVHVSHDVFLA